MTLHNNIVSTEVGAPVGASGPIRGRSDRMPDRVAAPPQVALFTNGRTLLPVLVPLASKLVPCSAQATARYTPCGPLDECSGFPGAGSAIASSSSHGPFAEDRDERGRRVRPVHVTVACSIRK